MVFRRLRDRQGFFPSRHFRSDIGQRLEDDHDEDDESPRTDMATPSTDVEHQQQPPPSFPEFRASPQPTVTGSPMMSQQGDVEVDDVIEPRVARAWMVRRELDLQAEQERRETLRQQQLRCLQPPVPTSQHSNPQAMHRDNSSSGGRGTSSSAPPPSRPVDVDNLSVWEASEQPLSSGESQRASSHAGASKMKPPLPPPSQSQRKPPLFFPSNRPLPPRRPRGSSVASSTAAVASVPDGEGWQDSDGDESSSAFTSGTGYGLSSSAASVALSDHTPVVSNRNFHAPRPARQPKQQPNQYSTFTGPGSNVASLVAATTGTESTTTNTPHPAHGAAALHQKQKALVHIDDLDPEQQRPQPDDDEIHSTSAVTWRSVIMCRDLWNPRRVGGWQGKLLSLSMLLLLLSVTMLVTMAVLYQRGNNNDGQSAAAGKNESGNGSAPNATANDILNRGSTPTQAPSQSPKRHRSSAPTVVGNDEDVASDSAVTLDVVNRTAAPTATPTLIPTALPSLEPTQSTAFPTSVPSLAIAFTTLELSNSTSSPTAVPSLVAQPTAFPPPPTLAPTKSFDDFVQSLVVAKQQPMLGRNVGDEFGSSVALSGDGTVLAIGAPKVLTTSTIMFTTRTNGTEGIITIQEQQTQQRQTGQVYIWFQAPNDAGHWQSRGEVMLSIDDGKNALVQSPPDGDGSSSNTTAEQSSQPQQPDHTRMGYAVALNYDGSVLAVSEPEFRNGTGKVCLYSFNVATGRYDTLMGQELTMPSGDNVLSHFGASAKLSTSGQVVVIGSPYANQAFVFQFDAASNEWALLGQPLVGDAIPGSSINGEFGAAVDLVEDEDGTLTVAIGCPRDLETNGYVVVFQRKADDSAWKLLGGRRDMTNEPVSSPLGTAAATTLDGYGEFLSLVKSSSQSFRLAIAAPFKLLLHSSEDAGQEGTSSSSVGMIDVYELDIKGDKWVRVGDDEEPILAENTSTGRGDQASPAHAGYSVKLIDEGRLLVAGSPGGGSLDKSPGSLLLFRFDAKSNRYQPMAQSRPVTLLGRHTGDGFGTAIAVSRRFDDNRFILAVGAPHHKPGYVTVLEEETVDGM